MTSRAVVDTSVVLKWFGVDGEAALQAALGILESHIEGELNLCAPASMSLEASNVLVGTHLSTDSLLDAMSVLADYRIATFGNTEERLALACTLSRAYSITTYDAVFLALAIEVGCPLITADRKAFGHIPAEIAEVRLLL